MTDLERTLVDELDQPNDIDEAIQTDRSTATETDDRIRCRSCAYAITRGRWACQRDGAFEHRFRNPAGWSFQVGCYSKAPGALTFGPPIAEHSWFAGYAWCFATCGRCGEHLGWWYSGGDTFAGLIVTRLK